MNSNDLLITTSAAGTTKYLVDLLKIWFDPPPWVPPLAALAIGIVVTALYKMLVIGLAWDAMIVAEVILGGIIAGAGAVGITRTHDKASQDPRGHMAGLIEQALAARKEQP